MTKNRFRWLAAIVALGAGPAFAQVTTCTASSMAMSLGVYEGNQPVPGDSSATFLVNCTRTGGPGSHVVTVTLGPSLNGGSIANRRIKLTTGPDTVAYNIYRDAGRTTIWGNTVATGVSLSQHIKNNTTVPFTFTFFGRIDALQDARAGTYTDSLLITVTF